VPFAAAIQKNNFLGCQFHPEKSSLAGRKFLKYFFNKL
jgi:glutamine amidotransferase